MATHFKQSPRLAGDRSDHRSPRIDFGSIRDMFAKPVRAPEPEDQHTERWVAFAQEAEPGPAEEVLPRFPIVRQGYDCPAVDEYIAELERELAEADRELAQARGQAAPSEEVNRELKRIGEQTSAVLIAAHEQRDEILRIAREEADRCRAEAAAEASALKHEAETRARELEARNHTTRMERDRLLEDVRRVSAGLAALAEPANEQSPPSEQVT
jgi:DivIVA protein